MEPPLIDMVMESAEVQADVAVDDPDEGSIAVVDLPEGPFLLEVD